MWNWFKVCEQIKGLNYTLGLLITDLNCKSGYASNEIDKGTYVLVILRTTFQNKSLTCSSWVTLYSCISTFFPQSNLVQPFSKEHQLCFVNSFSLISHLLDILQTFDSRIKRSFLTPEGYQSPHSHRWRIYFCLHSGILPKAAQTQKSKRSRDEEWNQQGNRGKNKQMQIVLNVLLLFNLHSTRHGSPFLGWVEPKTAWNVNQPRLRQFNTPFQTPKEKLFQTKHTTQRPTELHVSLWAGWRGQCWPQSLCQHTWICWCLYVIKSTGFLLLPK